MPTGPNPLGIKAASNRNDNYFLVIGDWGLPGGGGAQKPVAAKMKQYVEKQKAAGKTILFVAALGDNFYNMGVVNDAAWKSQWSDIYGTYDPSSPLHNVPWLAVMGNHDYGRDDPHCACGGACKQFNGQRPAGTDRYWMPSYNWNYTIPEVELEVIGLDQNGCLSYLGPSGGQTGPQCGDWKPHMKAKQAEGEQLLQERARLSSAKTVLIMQHYPSQGKRLLDAFRSANGNKAHALSVYGHDHMQKCEGDTTYGCDTIMSGGGGTTYHAPNHGFVSVFLKENGTYYADWNSKDVLIGRAFEDVVTV